MKETLRQKLEWAVTDGGGEAFMLTEFLFGVSALLDAVAFETCKTDYGELSIGGKKCGGGNGNDSPEMIAVFQVLTGADLMRHTTTFIQAKPFFDWVLDEIVPDDDEPTAWASVEWLGNKWNEFAAMRNGKKQSAESGKSSGSSSHRTAKNRKPKKREDKTDNAD